MSDDEEDPPQFPRWLDATCPHPPARQIPDGMGVVCADCGVLRIIAW